MRTKNYLHFKIKRKNKCGERNAFVSSLQRIIRRTLICETEFKNINQNQPDPKDNSVEQLSANLDKINLLSSFNTITSAHFETSSELTKRYDKIFIYGENNQACHSFWH